MLTETSPPPADPPFGSVVVAVSDLASLRAVVADLPALGRARMVAVVVAEAEAPLALRIHPRWPALQDLDARTEDGGAVTIARFTSRLDVAEVLAGIAYADGSAGHGGLVIAPRLRRRRQGAARRGDPRQATAESPVTGRAPVVVTDPGPEPLDETLFNPIGFRRDWDRGIVDLDPAGRRRPRSWPGFVTRRACGSRPGPTRGSLPGSR